MTGRTRRRGVTDSAPPSPGASHNRLPLPPLSAADTHVLVAEWCASTRDLSPVGIARPDVVVVTNVGLRTWILRVFGFDRRSVRGAVDALRPDGSRPEPTTRSRSIRRPVSRLVVTFLDAIPADVRAEAVRSTGSTCVVPDDDDGADVRVRLAGRESTLGERAGLSPVGRGLGISLDSAAHALGGPASPLGAWNVHAAAACCAERCYTLTLVHGRRPAYRGWIAERSLSRSSARWRSSFDLERARSGRIARARVRVDRLSPSGPRSRVRAPPSARVWSRRKSPATAVRRLSRTCASPPPRVPRPRKGSLLQPELSPRRSVDSILVAARWPGGDSSRTPTCDQGLRRGVGSWIREDVPHTHLESRPATMGGSAARGPLVANSRAAHTAAGTRQPRGAR